MRTIPPVVIAALLLLMAVSLSSAQPPGVDLVWSTVDGGGSVSSDGSQYVLSGSIGQPDAGSMSSDTYTLTGGFWLVSASSDAPGALVYLPLLQK